MAAPARQPPIADPADDLGPDLLAFIESLARADAAADYAAARAEVAGAPEA